MTGEPRQATVELEHRYHRGATEVLDRLRRARAEEGRIRSEDVDRIAAELGLPRAHVHGAASFYADLGFEPRAARTVRVCDGAACFSATGGQRLQGAGEGWPADSRVERVITQTPQENLHPPRTPRTGASPSAGLEGCGRRRCLRWARQHGCHDRPDRV